MRLLGSLSEAIWLVGVAAFLVCSTVTRECCTLHDERVVRLLGLPARPSGQ